MTNNNRLADLDSLINKIHLADCLEFMEKMPDKSLDMILTDLPYGQTSHEFDKEIDLDKFFEQAYRTIKDKGIICLTSKGKFYHKLCLAGEKYWRYDLVWDKQKGANFAQAKKTFLQTHEMISIFYKKRGTYNPQMLQGKPYVQKRKKDSLTGIADNLNREHITENKSGLRYPKSVITPYINNDLEQYYSSVVQVEGQAQRHITHPNQKPVSLYEYLIRTYSNEHDIIYDATSGSGTLAIACLNTARNYICSEKDKDIYSRSIIREQEHKKSLGLID